jgi:O-antigen/teichoic acid export membrane protein
MTRTLQTAASQHFFAAFRDPSIRGSLRARLIRGVSWNMVATSFNQGSTFLVNIVLANIWGRHLFGEYAMVQSTLAVVTTMAQVSMGYTATKYVAEFRGREPERAGRILTLCGLVSVATATIAALVLLFGSRRLAADALSAPQLAPALMASAVLVFFAVMSGFLMGTLAGLEAYPALARAGIASGIIYVLLCSIGGSMAGVTGAVAAQAITAAVFFVILAWLVVREAATQRIRFRLHGASNEADVLFKFAAPAALNSFVALPAIWLANAILVRGPNGYDQLALFAAANNFRILVLFVPQIVNNVGMSLLNNERGARNAATYARLFWTNLMLTVAIALIGAAALVAAGPWVLRVFGSSFSEGYGVLVALMIAVIPEATALATVQPMLSQERVWTVFFGRVVPCYATLLGVAWFTVPSHGAVGLAFGWIAGWSVALLADVMLVWRTGLWGPSRAAAVADTNTAMVDPTC